MKTKLPKDYFFEAVECERLALTFNDVRLKTGHSEKPPNDVNPKSMFSRNIVLKAPIVSAAMDTVTEHEMAIEMAKLGGIGIIHKNMSPERQAAEVGRVKYHLNGLIEKPITVFGDETIESILNWRKEKNYSFHSFPVIDRNGILVGLLTKNDFDFCDNLNKTASEVMTRQLVTGKANLSLDEAYELMKREKKKILMLVNSEMMITGMYVFSDLKRIKTCSNSEYNIDAKGQLVVGAAIGVYDDAFERVDKLIKNKVDVVVIDTAHGDSRAVIDTLREIKKRYPDLDVVVGNVSQPESALRLAKAGADGIKVGQGPGSICTTRVVAGIGCPQVTAIYKCSKAIEDYGIPICADGGITQTGDIPIAIGAGASSVMLGGMLAGTKEAPGEMIFFEGKQWKLYRGMGSLGAMMQHKGSRERYSQSGKDSLVPEGIEGRVEYKGPVKDVIGQCVGGLKKGMGYVGAADIKELKEKADFDRISGAGMAESHPHDVVITKESPNYRRR